MTSEHPSERTTLHMIGNAHLDPVWLWQWPEGFQEAKATFRSALDRMREFPDFVFTSSSAAIYEWVEESDPRLFAEIQERVAEGRWRIVGGWWIQPDCNLPHGESFVRQVLYGQRYFNEKFGVTATVGYNPDSFGHHAMLPQILQKSGLDSYVFMRPRPHEQELPARLFWWEAPDGSRVLAYRLPYPYQTTHVDLADHIAYCATEIDPSVGLGMCFYGVGNHGGGPTRANIELIRELAAAPDAAGTTPRLLFSSPAAFFERAGASDLDLPVVRDELQHHASGCYAVHSGVKRWNRRSENLLLAAEKWSAVAECVHGRPYPIADLTRAWKGVLFNQFHDILAGTSIEPAYDDARDTYGEAMAIAGRHLNHAIQSLSWAIDIPAADGMTPIVVFNPHAWPVRAGVELEFGALPEAPTLLDDEGQAIPLQTVQSLATVSAFRNRLAFVADLPPLGYRLYRLEPGAAPSTPASSLAFEDAVMENGRFRLAFDPATGHLVSLYDKRAEIEVLGGPAARPVVVADPSDTWGHDVLRFDDEIGAFAATTVRLVEHGPVRLVMRVESAYGSSRLTQDFLLYDGIDAIEVRVTVDWREQFKLLKLAFPLNLTETAATYEIPYGHLQRPNNGEEEPGQSWVDMTGRLPGSGEPYGLSLLNDGKYSFSTRDGLINLTVLRSPIYAHHEPYAPRPDEHYAFIDQGIQHFTYTLLPHTGTWRQAQAVRRAAELNQRPVALAESYHPGPLPPARSYLSVDRENIVVGALKRAEDGDALIVRCYETDGLATSARIHLSGWNRVLAADFGPCEIKTFLVPSDETRPATEVNLLEWPD